MMRPSPYSYKALPYSTFIQQTFAECPLKARFWAKTNKKKQNTVLTFKELTVGGGGAPLMSEMGEALKEWGEELWTNKGGGI